MVSFTRPRNAKKYRVGIDVGTHSVGLSAIEFDDEGTPVRILSSVSHLHDSGVLDHKTATTRLAASGVARRTRRLRRKRVKRLVELDRQIEEWGWQVPDPGNDPYAVWRWRARLASEQIKDESERFSLLAGALRHMARHRGWRNPYTSVDALLGENAPSDRFIDFRDRVVERTGRTFPENATIAELVVAALDTDAGVPLRSGKTENSREDREFSYFGGALHQSDNANELKAYAKKQDLSGDLLTSMIRLVFKADSPRGSWVGNIGTDPFDGQHRASKATDAFQRQRIIEVLANVGVEAEAETRVLTVEERNKAFEFLVNAAPGENPTWGDIAKLLDVPRTALVGVASTDESGKERLPLRPPVHVTNQVFADITKRELRPIRDWWSAAGQTAKDALVGLLVDGECDDSTPEGVEAFELLDWLDEDALPALDSLALPAGRSSYSVASLRKLTARMLESTDHLHAARKAVFDFDDNWVPPTEAIGAPIGNPAVDRVTKIVSRWLSAAHSQWGVPEQVTIEHVREAFMSESAARERDREMRKRYEENEKTRQELKAGEKQGSRVTTGDVRRHEAITRQKGQCAYCGTTITFTNSQMDHIVPRAGVGSTNTRSNLVAVCVPCNQSKSNQPFALWAKSRDNVSVDEAVKRTKFWVRDQGVSARSWSVFLKEVRERLTRTDSDPEIDARSMESVAWMANELRERIAGDPRFQESKVRVYQGAITAEARKAAGIEGKVPLFGNAGGKTRLDRRHHAVDAAVLTLLDESVARTLAERSNLRFTHLLLPEEAADWKLYTGSSPAARERFAAWKRNMDRLAGLLSDAVVADRIVVMESLRLRLNNGKIHDDIVRPLVWREVGDELSREEIDAASTPALWTALTRHPDFEDKEGLPFDPTRSIRVQGRKLGPNDRIGFFPSVTPAMAVRGGWAALGASIHHARIYRWEERGKTKYGMLRVYAVDLARHRHEDLFTAPISPSSISMRVADPSVTSNLNELEYLGWLVAGDELAVDMEPFDSGRLGLFLEVFGGVTRWRISSFESPVRVKLSPAVLAIEGLEKLEDLDDDHAEAVKYIFNRGWLVSLHRLLTYGGVEVIRRDALGRPRRRSRAGLPVSWRVE